MLGSFNELTINFLKPLLSVIFYPECRAVYYMLQKKSFFMIFLYTKNRVLINGYHQLFPYKEYLQ
jgi:hypothetical protein